LGLSFTLLLFVSFQEKKDFPTYRWDHGRPQGGKTGTCPFLEIGTKKQKFLENVKSGI